ncbi:MAG: hypothetical protein K2Z81_00395, partial [Cyanobacteria bacterium]|nr:hypothetical protein [Cyanobacteriota bacterium]
PVTSEQSSIIAELESGVLDAPIKVAEEQYVVSSGQQSSIASDHDDDDDDDENEDDAPTVLVADRDPEPAAANDAEDFFGTGSAVKDDFFGGDKQPKRRTREESYDEVDEEVSPAQNENRQGGGSFFEPESGDPSVFDFFSGQATASRRRPTKIAVDDSAAPAVPALQQETSIKPSNQTEGSFEKPVVAMSTSSPTIKVTDKADKPSVTVVGPKVDEAEHTSYKDLKKKEVDAGEDEEEDDEDEDDEEEEEKKTAAPKRRSFSGTPAPPAKKKRASDDDEDEDDEDEDEDEDDEEISFMERNVKFLGMQVPGKTAVVLVCIIGLVLFQIPGWLGNFGKVVSGGGQQVAQQAGGFLIPGQGAQSPQSSPGQQQGFVPGMGQLPRMGQGMPQPGQGQPGFPGIPNLSQQQTPNMQMFPQGQQQGNAGMPMPGQGMPLPGGAPAQGGQGMQQGPVFPNGQPPLVAGRWRMKVGMEGQVFDSMMDLAQAGDRIQGKGQDGQGLFDITGQIMPPDQILFAKKYDQESRRRGAPNNDIIFGAKLINQNGHYICQGALKMQKKQGFQQSYFNKARFVEVRGKWQGEQMSVVAAAPTGGGGGFSLPVFGGGGVNAAPQTTMEPDYIKAQKFFLWIGAGCIAVCVILAGGSLIIFGPSGLMNVWEKQKYIPSQFRAEHMKMVRELGGPIDIGGTPLGKRLEWRWWWPFSPKNLCLPAEVREKNPHVLVLGGGDKGKTRLMASMITYDIQSSDRAIILIDSDGGLADLTLEWIASQPDGTKYAKRVVLIDPTYKAGSLAYNPLEMPEDGNLQSAASAIVHGFKAVYTEPPGSQSQWNAQTANILRNAALLLMANGRSLIDLPSLLNDNDFRDIMLEKIEKLKSVRAEYITILETWNQYKKLARTDQWINWVEPILNRVGPMLSDGRIRPILTKPVSDLKLTEIITEKKILIVKVPEGELDQNAKLLGSLMITGLQQAAMTLDKRSPNSTRPATL